MQINTNGTRKRVTQQTIIIIIKKQNKNELKE